MTNVQDPRDLVEQTLAEFKRLMELPAVDLVPLQSVLPPSLAGHFPAERGTMGIYFALWGDVLRAVVRAVLADNKATEAERVFVYPLLTAAAGAFAREGGAEYQRFNPLEPEDTWAFLNTYTRSEAPFGGAHPESKFAGLQACFQLAQQTGDPTPMTIYERLILRVVDAIIALEGMSNEEAIVRRRLKDLIVQKRLFERVAAPAAPPPRDLRADAFLSAEGGVVFHAVAHAKDVFSPDPFDVEFIHAHARDAFTAAVERASAPGQSAGRSLLVQGRAGSGKTHLMRAFRRTVHQGRLGYAAYLQMSSRSESYPRYVLANVVDSLERPFDPPELEDSGLLCLSNALVERPEVPAQLRLRLQDEELASDAAPGLVGRITDALLAIPSLARVDPHVLSALTLLQRREPAVRSRVIKYLRCEPLTPYEQQLVGLAPRLGEETPLRTLEELGRVIQATGGGALVLLVDQMEDAYNLEHSKENFRRSQDALRAIQDAIPNSVVVLACLEDYYVQLRSFLSQAVLDRLERDPDPVRLAEVRSQEEIVAMVSARLQHLFEQAGAAFREEEPLFPFRPQHLEPLVNLRTRDVLDLCRRHQEACRARGSVEVDFDPRPSSATAAPTTTAPAALDLDQQWNDLRSGGAVEVPGSEEAQASLLSWALSALGVDARADGPRVEIAEPPTVVEVLNIAAQGGHFARRVEALGSAAAGRTPALVRASEFPGKIGSKAYELLGAFVRGGGRKVVAEEAELRAMVAFQRFQAQHGVEAGFARWAAEQGPLAGLVTLQRILGADGPVQLSLPVAPTPAPVGPPPPAPRAATPAPSVPPVEAPPEALVLGVTRTLLPEPVTLTAQDLKTHAAFLGASGSGKTTLALNLLEQLALQGVPALLVDRKGDLAAYGLSEAWATALEDPALEARRDALRARLDVHIYTPGEARGRPLAIPVVPNGLHALPTAERAQVARYAASSLAAMMGYKSTQQDKTRISILGKAIEVLGSVPRPQPPTLNELSELLFQQDPSLVNAIGLLDTKHFPKIVEGLETLRITSGHLFDPAQEQLDPQALLGLGPHRVPGRTRLSVVSTKFLNDTASVQFWVARLLMELRAWAGQSPSDKLQAVLLLDEADIYLPAMEKPATKEPLLDLIKRARSAGLGVLLATQSPGDLDYKARDNIATWFVGKVTEKTALNKMRPLFTEYKGQVADRLALCRTGDFFRLHKGSALELRAHRSVIETVQLPEDRILALARGPA
jgi:hypothetical protein